MGLCGSAQQSMEDEKNRKIEKAQQAELKRQDDIIKLLLLGAGESGKSTIFKQLKLCVCFLSLLPRRGARCVCEADETRTN